MDEKEYDKLFNQDGRLKKYNKRDRAYISQRAKAMGDEYYRLASTNHDEDTITHDIEATRSALYALSAEVLIKSILYDRSKTKELVFGHELFELFEKLPISVKKAAYLKAESLGLPKEEFIKEITRLSRTFITHRYCYELMIYEEIYPQIKIVSETIKEISDMYHCNSNLKEWNLSEYRKELHDMY